MGRSRQRQRHAVIHAASAWLVATVATSNSRLSGTMAATILPVFTRAQIHNNNAMRAALVPAAKTWW